MCLQLIMVRRSPVLFVLVKKQRVSQLRYPLLLFAFHTRTVLAEQQGNAPQTRKRNNGINDPAQQCILAAKKPGNQVELEDAHKTPVDGANDRKDQRNGIHLVTSVK